MLHHYRRGSGERDEADLEVLLLECSSLREHLGRAAQREDLRERGERGRGADRLEKAAARGVLRKHGAHDRRGDHALVALVLAFSLDRRALELPPRVVFVLGLAAMPAAGAARSL